MHLQVVLLLEDVIALGTRVDLSLSSRLFRAFVRLFDMLVQVAATGERLVAVVVGADERFLLENMDNIFELVRLCKWFAHETCTICTRKLNTNSQMQMNFTHLALVLANVTLQMPVDEEVGAASIERTVLLAVGQVLLLVDVTDLLVTV